MTTLKEQAVTMLESIPDDKMSYVVDMLGSIINNKSFTTAFTNSSKQEAWERLQKYKGIITRDIDEKFELAKARDEKYADFI